MPPPIILIIHLEYPLIHVQIFRNQLGQLMLEFLPLINVSPPDWDRDITLLENSLGA